MMATNERMNSETQPMPQVLIVEDERKLRESLAEGLRLEEWMVATAATGAEAMHVIASAHFDLVILDWMLPDYDGIEVLRWARARHPGLRVLMITARVAHADRQRAHENGVAEFLPKPFAFDDLLARCSALLGISRASPASGPRQP
jgi:DNA-binding response OmpR family regulator